MHGMGKLSIMQTFSIQLSTSELPQSRKVSAGVKIAPCVGKGRANWIKWGQFFHHVLALELMHAKR